MKRVALCLAMALTAVLAVKFAVNAMGVPQDIALVSGLLVVGFLVDVWPRLFADPPPVGAWGWLRWAMVWLAIGVVTAADTWGWRGIGVACFAVAVGAGIAAARQRRRAVPVHDPPEWVPAQR